MFARFFKKSEAPAAAAASTSTPAPASSGSASAAPKDDSSDDGNKSDNSNDGQETLEFTVDIGGNRGWTTNVTVMMYHRVQGLICVGTEGGAIYVYGDGFQFVRTWLIDDPNEVVSIVPLHPNKILVAFADNSIVALELPTLEVLDLLPPTWLSSKDGDLTSIYCDLPSEKNFVYCGTSEGNLYVLDVMESAIRICDYSLTAADLGIAGQKMAITDIQINPRNDRFLAVGCDGPHVETGMISVFDLEKHKLHKNFKTAAISNITWHHMGEILYCSTRNGVIHSIHVEKGTVANSWNAKGELLDECNDEDDEEGSNLVSIRKISWLAPQSNAMTDTGCLFALLTTRSADNDNLQNVILGFSPVHGELTTIFSLPPIPNEKIMSFRIVPTYDRSAKELGPDDDVTITPGLLLLTQRQNQDDSSKFDRHVKIIRCPSVPLSEWALEIGALPDPRKATEVQPSAADVTCIRGLLPKYKNPLSLAKALIMGVIGNEDNVVSTASLQKVPALQDVINSNEGGDDEDVASLRDNMKNNRRASQGRRLSARDFFEKSVGVGDLETQLNEMDPWEMVLVAGEHEEKTDSNGKVAVNDLRVQDIVFNGHADGTVVAFGVSLPDNRKETGKGNVWLPLKALRCGTTAVTTVTADETCGLLCVGDEEGYLVLYEIFDEDRQIGSTDIIRWVYDKFSQQADDMVAESGDNLTENVKNIDDFHEQQYYQELYASYHDNYKFQSLKQVFRIRLHDHISCIHLNGAMSTIVVGTSDGSLYCCNNHADLKAGNNLKKVESVMTTGACGAVKSIEYGYYHIKSSSATYADQLTFAYYVFYESGHVLVIDAVSFNIISYSIVIAKGSTPVTIYEASALSILGNTNKIVKKPTLLSFLYVQARTKKLQEAATAAGEVQETSPPPAPVPEQPVKRGFFSRAAAPPPAPLKTATSSSSNNVESKGLKHKTMEFSENDVPAKICFAKGVEIVTMNLDKFFSTTKRIGSFSSLASGVGGVAVKSISKKPIVASVIFTLTEEGVTSDGFDSFELQDGENYLACMDEEGCLRVVSLKTKSVVSHANLLEGLTEGVDTTLYAGTLLSNGNCYMLQKGTMLYSASVTCADQKLVFSLPERAVPHSRGIDRSHVLLHGREQYLAGLKMTIKKRRSSVINLSAAPTDLYKIFAKTREQRAKEELFSGASDDRTNENSATRTNAKATKAKTDMQELQQNFAERGDRINRIALKMDDFKQNAQEYKQTAQAQKELLRQRNARWGLF